MHTTKIDDYHFHHNSDLSGSVTIVLPFGSTFMIPGRVLVEFVAEFIRLEQIAAIEQMTTSQLIRSRI